MKTIIGIIGGIGSGKDTVADYIARKLTMSAYQISQPVKDIAKTKGLEPTRDNLVELGTKIAQEKGADFIIKVLLERINHKAIITGLRQLPQIEYLRKNTKLILIAIEAEPRIRFNRATARNKPDEAKTIEEFINNEQSENSGQHIQRLFDCMKLADYTIENNADLESLFKKIDYLLKQEKLS
ncbi:MAG: AAA family ATPase [Candidatus Kerfeldbacteria bacterium]|nr:AAA family ATPase [Candidatus Kerfeldbacteria bacterium]